MTGREVFSDYGNFYEIILRGISYETDVPPTPLGGPLEAFPCVIHHHMLISSSLHATLLPIVVILLLSITKVYASIPLVYVVFHHKHLLTALNF